MLIHPALGKAGYAMDSEQEKIVSHKSGPLLVIAGPGSGKTRSLALLTMNLLLYGDAEPSQIVLCTYTEKAAYELQDRMASIAKDVHYTGDLSQLKMGTIHRICQQLVNEHLHSTSLIDGYETLDQFTQQLLIFNNLNEICLGTLPFWENRCSTHWAIAKELKAFFDTITEELIFEKLQADLERLERAQTSKERLSAQVTRAYERYRILLRNTNSVDFAHLQKWAHKLLNHPETSQKIVSGIRYVLVDEYQDTNYIQEQLLINLASGTEPKNLIVIGDEDQALYRFRGATVRNILTFKQTFPSCPCVYLATNYRSQEEIVRVCSQWIEDFDWSNGDGGSLRTKKSLRGSKIKTGPVPSAMHLDAVDPQDEAEQLAELIDNLKKHGKITDYSDVALLLHSVKTEASQPYIQALEEREIPVYCPRAGTFFQQAEIMLLFGCLAYFLRFPGKAENASLERATFAGYLAGCLQELEQFCQKFPAFRSELQRIDTILLRLSERNERLDGRHLAKAFYQLLFTEHVFSWLGWLDRERMKANFVRFSRLLEIFQKQYGYSKTSTGGLNELREALFEHFFIFLYEEGMNEEEDQQRPFLQGHVQVMTIHQAKGLEFPVVLVGKLDKLSYHKLREERLLLQPYFQYPLFEPKNRIPGCDRKRLYYVALSRARDLLVLSTSGRPDNSFLKLWQGTPAWQEQRAQLAHFPVYEGRKEHELTKPRYGVTTHIKTYQTCPRRYSYFYEYRFAPSAPANVFLGQLVHQTIEQLHRWILTHTFDKLNEEQVQKTFDKTYAKLLRSSQLVLSKEQKEQAHYQIMNYYRQNQREMRNIEATEFHVQIDREAYVLLGKIDLLVNGEQGLELFDFKAQKRPEEGSADLFFYTQQLYLYAYALQKQIGQFPQRLWLYWTAEEQRANALMEISCNKDEAEKEISFVDELAEKIRQKQFDVRIRPSDDICNKCDIQRLCKKEGVI